MPTFKVYSNGFTMGRAGPGGSPGKRGRVAGWSAGAVRRHQRWLYSVNISDLTGFGYALTLTVRDVPAGPDDWKQARELFVRRLRDSGHLVRFHWVTEWQTRGAPHMHAAVYLDEPLDVLGRWRLLAAWLDVLEGIGLSASLKSQTCEEITGTVGWLGYLSKHAARGVRHYQRQGMPPGWETTGRLWGYGGAWPVVAPAEGYLTEAEFFRLRRLARAWRVADARKGLRELEARYAGHESSEAARKHLCTARRRVVSARGMLRHGDGSLSRLRGVSEWIPEPVALRLLEVVREAA